MTDRIARLRGHLDVLLAVQEELSAINASQARLERNREQIAYVRAELRYAENTGDPTDATERRGS
jgi:hypothetical protein